MPERRTPLTPLPEASPEPPPPESSTEADLEAAEAYLSEGLEPVDFHAYDPAVSKRGTTTGPNGEKRPRDPIACATMVAKIATGEIEEVYEKPRKRRTAPEVPPVSKRERKADQREPSG